MTLRFKLAKDTKLEDLEIGAVLYSVHSPSTTTVSVRRASPRGRPRFIAGILSQWGERESRREVMVRVITPVMSTLMVMEDEVGLVLVTN